MSFALLLSHLPHVEESRAHYDTMLSLPAAPRGEPRRRLSLAVPWRCLGFGLVSGMTSRFRFRSTPV